MKKFLKNGTIKIIVFSLIALFAINTLGVYAASDDQEKEKIKKFMQEEENNFFLTFEFNKVDDIKLGDRIGDLGYWLTRFCPAENAEEKADSLGDLLGTFSKTKADEFLTKKIGITTEKINDFEFYTATHVLTSDKDVYYHVMKNGGPGMANVQSINSVTKLENGQIKVEYTFQESSDVSKNAIVVLKENNNTYMFVSNTYTKNTNEKILQFLQEEQNKIFLSYNYSKVQELELGDNVGDLGYWLVSFCPASNAEKKEDPNGDLYGAFSKTKANSFLKEKIGITIEQLKNYEQDKKKHVLSSNEDVYYHVVKNGEYVLTNVENITKVTELDGNQFKVEYTYNNGKKGTVVLKSSENNSFVFVSNTIETENKNDNKTEQPTIVDDGKKDDTTAPATKLPQTGESIATEVAITFVSIITLATIILIKRNNFRE